MIADDIETILVEGMRLEPDLILLEDQAAYPGCGSSPG